MFTLILWLAQFFNHTPNPPHDFTYENSVYTVYFSTKFRDPCLVTYWLYRGGGDCSRDKMYFTGDSRTARVSDYAKSGFDAGHLCNAEDFAFDCVKEKQTFRFYNALPQTPSLNRGVWKADENRVRMLSHYDSVFVLCGGIYVAPLRTIGRGVVVPTYCFKVVQSHRSKQILLCRIYTNTDRAVATTVPLVVLEDMLGYKLPLR